jgi:hypothetical protein
VAGGGAVNVDGRGQMVNSLGILFWTILEKAVTIPLPLKK